MARAGKALKRVLTRYGISQNQLATTMGIDRSNVSRWVSESRDPSAEAVAQIKQALVRLQPAAAEEFVQFYLYEGMEEAQVIAPSSSGNGTPNNLTISQADLSANGSLTTSHIGSPELGQVSNRYHGFCGLVFAQAMGFAQLTSCAYTQLEYIQT
ncbi:MAG: helix-turn-helix transcriptional regulator [Alkalinema sp. RL_2_19]|nr:helix-turn-helix transcriptional regulator [Alkalinema sp. RL_2_19]